MTFDFQNCILTMQAPRGSAQQAGIQVILFDRTIDADESLYVASIVSDLAKEGQTAVNWLASQNLETYNVIHIQGVMGSAAQIGRTGALDEMVAANDNWNLVTQQTAEWNAENAQQIVAGSRRGLVDEYHCGGHDLPVPADPEPGADEKEYREAMTCPPAGLLAPGGENKGE